MANERAEYGDEVTVGKESGVVKGSVGVPGGREVTVLVFDDKDDETRSFGVMESAKYSAANANGEEETRKLNEARWAASEKDNEEAEKDSSKAAVDTADSTGRSGGDAKAENKNADAKPVTQAPAANKPAVKSNDNK